jgi:hypothetical protein
MVHRTSESATAPVGHPAVTADALWMLTDLVFHCEFVELRRELESLTAAVHCTSTRGTPLNETEKLLDEALWYLRAGDVDEMAYRLREAEDAYKTREPDEDEE